MIDDHVHVCFTVVSLFVFFNQQVIGWVTLVNSVWCHVMYFPLCSEILQRIPMKLQLLSRSDIFSASLLVSFHDIYVLILLPDPAAAIWPYFLLCFLRCSELQSRLVETLPHLFKFRKFQYLFDNGIILLCLMLVESRQNVRMLTELDGSIMNITWIFFSFLQDSIATWTSLTHSPPRPLSPMASTSTSLHISWILWESGDQMMVLSYATSAGPYPEWSSMKLLKMVVWWDSIQKSCRSCCSSFSTVRKIAEWIYDPISLRKLLRKMSQCTSTLWGQNLLRGLSLADSSIDQTLCTSDQFVWNSFLCDFYVYYRKILYCISVFNLTTHWVWCLDLWSREALSVPYILHPQHEHCNLVNCDDFTNFVHSRMGCMVKRRFKIWKSSNVALYTYSRDVIDDYKKNWNANVGLKHP